MEQAKGTLESWKVPTSSSTSLIPPAMLALGSPIPRPSLSSQPAQPEPWERLSKELPPNQQISSSSNPLSMPSSPGLMLWEILSPPAPLPEPSSSQPLPQTRIP